MSAETALAGYSTIAPYYDRYTAHPDFPRWIRRIEALARAHGYAGGPILDAACGTGASLAPLQELGYELRGFDACSEMLAQARKRLGELVPLHHYNVCELPVIGQFALITWLGDACNCLVEESALGEALYRLAANLSPQGLLIFDASTTATFAGVFAESHRRTTDDLEFVWEGRTTASEPGCLGEATLKVYSAADGRLLAVSEHIQRHHADGVISERLAAAGLDLVARLGQEPTGELTSRSRADQPKLLYVAQKPLSATNEGRENAQGQASGQAGRSGSGDHQARLASAGARTDDGAGAIASSREARGC